MNKFLSFAAVAAMFAAVSVATPANAGERNFTLYNNTPWDIIGIDTSHYDAPYWITATNAFVGSERSNYFRFPDDGTQCLTQLKIHWRNGVTSTFNPGFDLCSATSLDINSDSRGHINGTAE